METNYCEILSNWEDEVGKVTVEIQLTSDRDIGKAADGALPADKIRSTKVQAIVDTGATILVLPLSVIEQLGLPVIREARSRFADGRSMMRKIYGPIKLEVQRRVAIVEALCAPEGVPALLGQVPLELLDLLVDSKNRRLIPNPESSDPDVALVDVY